MFVVDWIIAAVLNWLRRLVTETIAGHVRDKANHAENVNQSAKDMEKTEALKPESTEKEVDDAIDDSLKHF